MRPTTNHLATTLTTPATAPAISSTTPLSAPATQKLNRMAMFCSVSSTPTPIPKVTIIGMMRQVSTMPRITLRRNGGSKVSVESAPSALRRNRFGGLPIHEEPDLALWGVADRTATNASLGTLRPGWVIPELPRNARLPIRALAMWIQPPPNS